MNASSAPQRPEAKGKSRPPSPTTSFQDLLRPAPEDASGIDIGAGPAVVHQCPAPNCGRQFTRKYTLTEHLKTHTGEKPHACPVRTCSKRFSTSGNLARHKRLHGYIEPLPCPVDGCVCTFPSDIKLEKHMKFHYGGPVQACEVLGCGKTFSTTGNLNRHMKNQHPNVHNPNATPTAASKKRPKKSLTGAEDWAHSSGIVNDELEDVEEEEGEEEEDEDEEDEDDMGANGEGSLRDDSKLQHQHESRRWSHSGDTIKVEPGTQLGEYSDRSLSDANGGYEEELKPDGTLDSLSSLLQDTDISKQHTKRSARAATDAEETPGPVLSLFDDIIRFHVEDLGGYHATAR